MSNAVSSSYTILRLFYKFGHLISDSIKYYLRLFSTFQRFSIFVELNIFFQRKIIYNDDIYMYVSMKHLRITKQFNQIVEWPVYMIDLRIANQLLCLREFWAKLVTTRWTISLSCGIATSAPLSFQADLF